MLVPVLEAVVKQAGIEKKQVEDIVIGNVMAVGSGQTISRIAGFLAGFPETTCVQGINRLCSSGLQAVATVANAIKAGEIGIGIAGGVESMSSGNMADAIKPDRLCEAVFEHEKAQHCLMPMGITSENVAAEYGITRQQQDQLAVDSHAKAANANKNGWAQQEITPYTTLVTDKDGNTKEVRVA